MENFLLSIQDFFQYEFLLYAFIATLLLALTCALISPLIIARKNSFIGAAISHSTLLGLAIALSITQAENDFLVLFITVMITTLLTSFLAISKTDKTPDDSKLGIFYTSTMALGILIYSLGSHQKNNLINFLFGNILLLNLNDLWISLGIFLFTFTTILIPLKHWLFVTIDPIGAEARRYKLKKYQLFFYLLMTLVIVTSVKLAGTILIETMLLTPGFFALNFARSIKQTFIYSILFALITAPLGLILANYFSLPSGATLAVVQFSLLMLSFLLKFLSQKIRV
ncbi:MAG: metal ABC transporter permease [Bacteriovoracaceae bacterium]|jgi:ABC-type Mn2+/Zn2+ transport system permease subunit|nr:metal ABC transporter permease [Bacteriovoracaceae bacterium]